MLFRNKAGLSVLTAVVGATAVAPALADTGFYVGLMAGQSRFHQTKSDGDALAVAGWNSGPDSFTYDIASSSINNNDIAFSAVVGYRFMPEFSIEATYTDLGESKYRSAGRLNLVTEFSVEFHSQAVVPFLIRSISDSGCGIATRNFLAFW